MESKAEIKEEKDFLKISDEYLEELISIRSKNLVGKVLKRFEIFDDKETIKSSCKELIYEEFRTLRDLLVAHNKGLNITVLKFVKKSEGTALPN